MKLTREEAAVILAVDVDSDEATVRTAYKKLSLQWHPDKVPDERKAGAEERFKSINAACQKLTNKDADSDNSDFDMEESMEAAYAFFSFMQEFGMFGSGRTGRPRGRRSGPESAGAGPGIFMSSGGSSFVFMSPAGGGGGGRGGGGGIFGGGPYGGSRHRYDGYEEEYETDSDYEESFHHSSAQQRAAHEAQRARWEQQAAEAAADRQQQAHRAAQRAAKREQDLIQKAERERQMEDERFRRREEREAAREQRKQGAPKAAAEPAPPPNRVPLPDGLQQLPRPVQEERTETSISLRLLKPQAPLRQHMVLSLELRAHGDGAWREAVADAPAAVVTVSGLQPGTKYVFRSRGGMEDPDGRLVCGEYSAESVYPTLGNPPSTGGGAAAAAAAPSGGQQGRRKGGKGPKAAKAASTTGAEPQRQTSAAAQEAEREALCEKEAEKQRAVAAALAAAAADYERETARQKEFAAAGGGKKKKPPAEDGTANGATADGGGCGGKKGKKKAAKASQPKAESQPQPSPAAESPMRLSGATSNGHGAAGTSTLACERSSSSQSEASRRPDLGAQRPANLPHGAVRGGVGSASTAVRPRGMSQAQWELHQDEMALQEAIQLSLAMEESRRELEAASAAYAESAIPPAANGDMSAAAAAQAAALEVTDSPEQPAGGDWGGSAQQQHASGDWGAASHQAMAGEFAAPVPRAGGWGAPQPPPQQQQHQQQSAGGDWGAAQNGWAVQDPEYQDAHRSGSGDAAGAYSARMNTVGTDAPHADPYDEYYDHGGYGAHRGSGVSQTGDGPGGGEESSGSYESAASHVDAGDWADLQDEVPKAQRALAPVRMQHQQQQLQQKFQARQPPPPAPRHNSAPHREAMHSQQPTYPPPVHPPPAPPPQSHQPVQYQQQDQYPSQPPQYQCQPPAETAAYQPATLERPPRTHSTGYAPPAANGYSEPGSYTGMDGYAAQHPADSGYGSPPPPATYGAPNGYHQQLQPYQQSYTPRPGVTRGQHGHGHSMAGLRDPAIVYCSGPAHRGYGAGFTGAKTYLAEGQAAQRNSGSLGADDLSHAGPRPQRPCQRPPPAGGVPGRQGVINPAKHGEQAAAVSTKPYMPHLLPKAMK